jgi:hypothetical protein
MLQPILLPYFLKQIKRLLKKYPDLKDAFIVALKNFDKRQADNLGHSIYKIRLASRSINKGKNKSLRLIVLMLEIEGFIIPVTMYFKGAQTNITTKEINSHLCMILYELRTHEKTEK